MGQVETDSAFLLEEGANGIPVVCNDVLSCVPL